MSLQDSSDIHLRVTRAWTGRRPRHSMLHATPALPCATLLCRLIPTQRRTANYCDLRPASPCTQAALGPFVLHRRHFHACRDAYIRRAAGRIPHLVEGSRLRWGTSSSLRIVRMLLSPTFPNGYIRRCTRVAVITMQSKGRLAAFAIRLMYSVPRA